MTDTETSGQPGSLVASAPDGVTRADLDEWLQRAKEQAPAHDRAEAELFAELDQIAAAETRGMTRATEIADTCSVHGSNWRRDIAAQIRAAASQPAAQPERAWLERAAAQHETRSAEEAAFFSEMDRRSVRPDLTTPYVPRVVDYPEAGYSEWMPIESAPKDGSHMLMRRKSRRPFVGWWVQNADDPGWWTDGYARRDPTAFRLIFPYLPLAPRPRDGATSTDHEPRCDCGRPYELCDAPGCVRHPHEGAPS